jgi:hypothetical protein
MTPDQITEALRVLVSDMRDKGMVFSIWEPMSAFRLADRAAPEVTIWADGICRNDCMTFRGDNIPALFDQARAFIASHAPA